METISEIRRPELALEQSASPCKIRFRVEGFRGLRV